MRVIQVAINHDANNRTLQGSIQEIMPLQAITANIVEQHEAAIIIHVALTDEGDVIISCAKNRYGKLGSLLLEHEK